MSVWIGPPGALVQVPCEATSQPSAESWTTTATTLGGRVFAQRGRRPRRSWSLSLSPAQAPQGLGRLRALTRGMFGPGPFVWLDHWAAVTNLLTPEADLYGSGTISGAGVVTGAVTAGDGVVLPVSLSVPDLSAVQVGYATADPVRGVPVVPGRTFTGAVYVAGPGVVQVVVQMRDASGVVLAGSPQVTVTPGSVLSRAVVSGVAPAGAASAVVRVSGASVLAGPQITMTAAPVAWVPGEGAAWVVVDDLAVVPTIAAPSLVLAGASYVVREVG